MNLSLTRNPHLAVAPTKARQVLKNMTRFAACAAVAVCAAPAANAVTFDYVQASHAYELELRTGVVGELNIVTDSDSQSTLVPLEGVVVDEVINSPLDILHSGASVAYVRELKLDLLNAGAIAGMNIPNSIPDAFIADYLGDDALGDEVLSVFARSYITFDISFTIDDYATALWDGFFQFSPDSNAFNWQIDLFSATDTLLSLNAGNTIEVEPSGVVDLDPFTLYTLRTVLGITAEYSSDTQPTSVRDTIMRTSPTGFSVIAFTLEQRPAPPAPEEPGSGVIPEPMTGGLCALGFAALAASTARRRTCQA